MIELILRLLGFKREALRNVNPVLRALLHSQALTEAVQSSPSPVDDLVLRILRELIPPTDSQ
mgnify:CR=1 FL=1